MATVKSSLDLAFAMDCTSSMGSYIKSATDNIRSIVEEIVANEMVTVRLALIEYRDHPPQDATFVTRVHTFTNTANEMKEWLGGCSAAGGGDGPEAVADALYDTLNLPWRAEAVKICILISDAPPHGLDRNGDGFPDGCPAGHDPLTIVRKMAEKQIVLYTVGVEPPIVPYREFFMTLAHLTGGQYVPMTDANRLAQMIIGGVREEISLDRLMNSARDDITREMKKATNDGVDEKETALRLQKVFSKKNMYVNRMKNESGTPSKEAEECYAKCVDMSDMQKQYKKSETVTSTKPAEMDYGLEEEKNVSFEQAKRIVQKAKNWNYTAGTQGENSSSTSCKYGAACRDHGTYHRAKFSHPQNDDHSTMARGHETKTNHRQDTHSTARNNNSTTPCKHGADCYDQSDHHRTRYSHPQKENASTPCKHGVSCHDHSDYHRGKFSHPSTDHNRVLCRHGAKCYDQTDYHRAKYAHPDASS